MWGYARAGSVVVVGVGINKLTVLTRLTGHLALLTVLTLSALLAELAQRIALDPVQLDQLWRQQAASDHRYTPGGSGAVAPASAAGEAPGGYSGSAARPWDKPVAKGSGKGGRGFERWKKDTVPVYTGPRTVPASRADHAARLLLANMALWEHLAGEDQAMLCALAAPHGHRRMGGRHCHDRTQCRH